jgi:Carboxypeptidase regulatory-like domain
MRSALFALLAILLVQPVWGQRSILAGKMVDENDRPIPGVTISVGRAGHAVQTTSDSDGLFYTRLLPVGNYHITIHTADK